MNHCQYAVQKGQLMFWFDCAKRPVEEIDGSLFCWQHANLMKGLS